MGITSIQTRFISRDPDAERRSLAEVCARFKDDAELARLARIETYDKQIEDFRASQPIRDAGIIKCFEVEEALGVSRVVVSELKAMGVILTDHRNFMLRAEALAFCADPDLEAVEEAKRRARVKYLARVKKHKFVPPEGYLWGREAAKVLGITQTYLWALRDGKILAGERFGRYWLYRVANVEELKQKREGKHD